MFVSPICKENPLQKKAWDNLVVYDAGFFYAFFATGHKSERNPTGYATSLDVARSPDGVHWEFIARDQCFLEGAHAGYGVKKIGDYFYYYPTCSDHFRNETVHFKVFRTRDFQDWEYLGEQYDVHRDGRYYRARWEEMMIMDDLDEDGHPVMYGYVSCENNPEYPPSAAMVKSYDGISWEVLPPVKIEWGETPVQHGEQNFVFKLDGKYYFSNTFRAYMDTYGFGAYTFVGDSPFGPFKPDLEMFRLSGNSRREVTWFSHYTHLPDGTILAALWLSHDPPPEIPSRSFGIGALKKYITCNGHLRLAWWEGTEAAKGAEVNDHSVSLAYPTHGASSSKDTFTVSNGKIEITADRNGVIVLLNHEFNRERGFIIEGDLTATESSQGTHQHAVGAGFYFEGAPGEGIAMVPDTLGVTRSGKLRYADHRITDFDIYQRIGLVQWRTGAIEGTLAFDYDDTVGPFGHASYCGIRNVRKHGFRLLARGDYFELYIDNLYVQTYLLPETSRVENRIKAGFCVFAGGCVFENIRMWEMSF